MFLRTNLFFALVFPFLVGLLPGCSSCTGNDANDQQSSPNPNNERGDTPQLRGLQKVRMARPDLLRNDAGAEPAPTLSAAASGVPANAPNPGNPAKDGGP